MEMEEDSHIPIILGRPFLATAGAMIDVKNGKLSFQVGDEKVEFCPPQSMASPSSDDTCCRVDILEKALNQEAMTCHFVEDPLEATLVSCHVTGSQSGETEEYARLLDASTAYTGRQSPWEVLSVEQRSSKEEEKSSPKVELKPLPPLLRYEFLDPDHQFLVIASAKLDGPQLEKLLGVFRKHKGVIGYNIGDIKGHSHSLCMHHIILKKGH